MDLPDARCSERHGVEGGEDLVHGGPELPLDDLLCDPRGHGLRRVLELLEFEEDALGQNIRARGEYLPELDERRPEVVECAAQPHAEVGREELLQPLLLPPVPPYVEDEAEAVPDEDAAYLGETPEVARPGGPGYPSVRHARRRVRQLQSRRCLGLVALGRNLGLARGRRGCRGPVLEHPHPVLQLLDAEQEVLVILPRRKPAPPQALLQRGVDQRTRACGALAGAAHHVVDHRASFLALDAALLDEGVDDLLHLVPRRRSSPYLQQDQTLQRLAYRSAHRYLRIVGCTTYMITPRAVRRGQPLRGACGLEFSRAPRLVQRKDRRGDKDGAVRPGGDADEQGEGEVAQGRFPEDKERHYRDEAEDRGVDRTPHDLADGAVDHLVEAAPVVAHGGSVLPDPVEDDYGVVDRVPEHGKDGDDDNEADLPADDGVETNGHQYIVHERGHSGEGESELESEADKRHDDEQRCHHGL